jgi:hypothetical protein
MVDATMKSIVERGYRKVTIRHGDAKKESRDLRKRETLSEEFGDPLKKDEAANFLRSNHGFSRGVEQGGSF